MDAQTQPQIKTRRRWIRWGAFAVLILLAGAAAYAYVYELGAVSTDDATINADTVAMMAKVPAYVQALTVANRTVVAGNYVEPGQLLLSLVPTQLYVIANFKETQLAGITVGQKARVTIDALGRSLPAHVDRIQRGSGSVFALLPPENATGNFVKVVQRLPVKLLFDAPPDALKRLAPGMSVEVTMEPVAHGH